MAGIRLLPEESETTPQQQARATAATTTTDSLASDDDRSIAADSWSIKSEYGSTLDDDQRHNDAAEALSSANFRVSSDYSSDKEEPDADGGGQSMLGLQSYWDAAYSDELTNFREHGHAGEVWFGDDVMEIVTSWTKDLCVEISKRNMSVSDNDVTTEVNDQADKYLSSWNVLDLGTGNGLLLHQLAKEGFSDLTGTDYSEGAVELAQHLSQRDGFPNISFMVDDILDTKLERQFKLVMDKGTLDAIGLHPDGPVKRVMYWDSVSKLVAPGGILATEMSIRIREMMYHKIKLNKIFSRITGKPESEIEGDTDRDNFLNPWEAKEYGFVDAVIDDGKPGLIAPIGDGTSPPKTKVWDLWKVEGTKKDNTNLPSERSTIQNGYAASK